MMIRTKPVHAAAKLAMELAGIGSVEAIRSAAPRAQFITLTTNNGIYS